MEKKKKKKSGEASSYSGWCLNADADQSQWLHATLSELEKKIKMMVSIIEEEEEETFTETKYKNRPKLIEMIKDLHLWYLTLADDYKRNHPYLPPTPVPTSSLRQLNTPKFNNNLSEEDVTAPNSNCGAREEEINNNKDEDEDEDEEKPNNDDGIEEEGGNDDDDVINVIMGKEGVRMMKMWRSLVEENKRQQDELIKRNNEKRDEIKELWLQIGKLKKENKALKTSLGLGHTNFDMMKMMMLINNQNNKSTPSSTTTTTISSRLKSFLLPAKFFR